MAKKRPTQWQKITKDNLPPIGKPVVIGCRLYASGFWQAGSYVRQENVGFDYLKKSVGATHWAELPAWFYEGPPADTGEKHD